MPPAARSNRPDQPPGNDCRARNPDGAHRRNAGSGCERQPRVHLPAAGRTSSSQPDYPRLCDGAHRRNARRPRRRPDRVRRTIISGMPTVEIGG